ncbi:MAG: 6-bladed beta-propeller [Candidatus Aegiribacteria sp.]|nr:6-bladed beta-propeller [Candidatus Aegiribacteria sp.]
MKKILFVMFSVLILALACGGEQPIADESTDGDNEGNAVAEAAEYVLPEADVYITISNSIGIELGDSNYVFGQIVGADVTPEGRIAVLDMQQSCISIFSPSGEFVRRIGRQGSGPGEFLLASGMSFFSGENGIVVSEMPVVDSLEPGAVVSDGMAGKLIYFDTDMEYMMDVQGFFPSPPTSLTAVNGGDIIGMKPEFLQNEEGMFLGFTVARWELGETEPSVIYFESMSPFDPSDLSSMQGDVVVLGATPEGIVFTAPMSSELYEFASWNPDGEELFTVTDENFVRVLKTQEEIDIETEMVNSRMVQGGMPPEMANWEPDPYRIAIAGIWVDGLDRLWVTKGTTLTPSYNVYDMEGNLLFTAALDAGEKASTWQTVIRGNRILAFDADPEHYPQIFIGDLPGTEDYIKTEDEPR